MTFLDKVVEKIENRRSKKKEVTNLEVASKVISEPVTTTAYDPTYHFPYRHKVVHVVYKDPLTIINWTDGVKTIVRCKDGEVFDEYIGFLACVAKRVFGGHGHYRRHIENAHRIDITEEGVK